MFSLFKNSITYKVEKKRKLEAEVELLKKQQKVEVEKCSKKYATSLAEEQDAIEQQISMLKAQIEVLKTTKTNRISILNEEKKVEMDRIIKNFDLKIISKQNQVKKLGHLIDAELLNEQDVINPDKPNSPKPLFEEEVKQNNTKKSK